MPTTTTTDIRTMTPAALVEAAAFFRQAGEHATADALLAELRRRQDGQLRAVKARIHEEAEQEYVYSQI